MKKNMKKYMSIITNVLCALMGYVLTQDNITFYRVGIVIVFGLWIITQTVYDKD